VSTPFTFERKLLSLTEVAEILGVSERTVRRYVAAGDLDCRRIGRRTLRVPVESVSALIEARPVGNYEAV